MINKRHLEDMMIENATDKEDILYNKSLQNILNNLDETFLEKHKIQEVPDYVAEYLTMDTNETFDKKIEKLILSRTGDPYYFCEHYPEENLMSVEMGEDIYEWTLDIDLKTIFNLLNGFSKTLYWVQNNNGDLLLKIRDNGEVVETRLEHTVESLKELSSRGIETNTYTLTKEEIKGFDERYLAFKIPVNK